MRFQYDKSSKWLIETHADAILRLAGVGPVKSWRALPGELVQSRQLPDGLVEVVFPNRSDPVLHLIEISTYPDNRVPNQLLDDIALTYLNRRIIPEVVALVLSPKGHLSVDSTLQRLSPTGATRLEAAWHVINLWEVDASGFLPLTDPGLAPWIPLTKIDGPPEQVLQQCRDVIDQKTTGSEHENLLGVTRILGTLRYDERLLARLFTRDGKMLEIPFLQKAFRDREVATRQSVILEGLEFRFGAVPADISAAVRLVEDDSRLKALTDVAYTSGSLDDFRAHLITPPAN
jgi:hypothetical protein